MSEMIHVKVRLAQGSDTYVIRDVTSDDEGRYFCRATNAFGVKEASVDVRMLGEAQYFRFRFAASASVCQLRADCQLLHESQRKRNASTEHTYIACNLCVDDL